MFGGEAPSLGRAAAETCREIATLVNSLSDGVASLVEVRKRANRAGTLAEKARLYSTDVLRSMDAVRQCADRLEMLVDDGLWPLPKYRELLSL